MQEEKIVRLEAGEFVWEEVPGKGRCLVPLKGKLRLIDMRVGRSFRNKKGEVLKIIEVRQAFGATSTYHLLRSEGYTKQGYRTMAGLYEELKPYEGSTYAVGFDCWID